MLAALLLCVISLDVIAASTVKGVRLWRAPDNTRLVFDLSGPVDHKVFELKSPDRLVIDVEDAKFSASVSDLDFSNTPIDKLRFGKRGSNGLRIVLDMMQETKPRSFVLKAHAGKPDRLVVDLYDKENATVKTVETVRQIEPSAKRDILVAIDAGHGGEDPGSIGPGRLYEKDVVLKVSQALKKLIDAEPGYRATLIRTGDYYVVNSERREKARNMRADLFISIHADGFKDPRAKGASVFALSRRGATSQMARILASTANDSDLIGGAGNVSLKDKDDVLAGVLVDLSMTATLASSLDLGGRVLKNMGKVTRLHKDHVEQANFIVLKSPDVPSILVETGFITNPTEASKLKTAHHQNLLAKSVFDGVKSYFYDNPPQGTHVAHWKAEKGQAITHVIARGDTLSSIALRYRVSVGAIKAHNQLNTSIIRVGQVISIPAS